MKHNITVLAVLLFICIWYGCKKENDPTPEPGQSKTPMCRVKTVRDDDRQPFRSVTYEYDANGKITKSIKQDGSYTRYEYSGNQLIIKEYTQLDQPIKPSVESILYLNSQGYVSREITKYSQFVSDTIDYTYSPDGFLQKEFWRGQSSSTTRSTTITYAVENSNITKIEAVSVKADNSTRVSSVLFTFLTTENKAGLYQYLSGDNNPMSRFYGRPNKNLINTHTNKYDNKTEVSQYNYDMKDGLPSYSYLSLPGNPDYFKTKYEFECK